MINLEKLKGMLFLFQVSAEKHLQLKKNIAIKIKQKFAWKNKLFVQFLFSITHSKVNCKLT